MARKSNRNRLYASLAAMLPVAGLAGWYLVTNWVQRNQDLPRILQDADVRHHLPRLLVGGGHRRGGGGDRQRQRGDSQSVLHNAHFAVITKCARRFFENAVSSWPGSNGNSFP